MKQKALYLELISENTYEIQTVTIDQPPKIIDEFYIRTDEHGPMIAGFLFPQTAQAKLTTWIAERATIQALFADNQKDLYTIRNNNRF